MTNIVNLTINGKKIKAPAGMTVLEAAQQEDIYIPTLCHHKSLDPEGTCRLCIVEISGSIRDSIRISCIQEVKEGLIVETDTKKINNNRKLILELLLGRAPEAQSLKKLAAQYSVTKSRFETGESNDCILCGRCVRVCRDKIGMHALCFVNRGPQRKLTTDFERLSEYCIGCGACTNVCPTGAIRMEDKGDQRKIFTWDQVTAKFTLERCTHCNKPFAPKRYLELINKKAYTPKGLEYVDYICPDCFSSHDKVSDRRREMALMKSTVKWSVPRG